MLLAHLRLAGRPSTLCTLRAITGLPCPFCGGTTAAVHIGSGDMLGALRASPLALLGTPIVAVWPVLRGRLARFPSVARLGALLTALAGSELWQLHRFGWM